MFSSKGIINKYKLKIIFIHNIYIYIFKACSVDQKNIEALLLHGMILTSMKKYSDAILQFRKANDVSY